MTMKHIMTLLLVAIVISLSFQGIVSAGDMHKTWIEPSSPNSCDTIRFNYEDPNTTDISIIVLSDDNSSAFIMSNHGRDGDVWWIEVRPLPAGHYFYRIKAHEDNGTYYREDVHFTVADHYCPNTDAGNGISTKEMAMIVIIALAGIAVFAYMGKRRK